MFAIIPLLRFVLIFLFYYLKSVQRDALSCWRRTFLSASIVWGLPLTAMTEFLSFFNLITFGWVLGLWGLASLMSAFIRYILISGAKPAVRFKTSNLPRFDTLVLFGTASIVVAVEQMTNYNGQKTIG